jgi:RND family efflux transporter MFP subunit
MWAPWPGTLAEPARGMDAFGRAARLPLPMSARLLIPLSLLLLLVACGGEEATAGHGGGGGGRPALVRTAEASTGDLREVWRIPGSVRARRRSALAAAASGRIVEVTAREGDTVARGDTLVRMDAGRTEAALAGARAGRSAAEASAERAEATWTRVQAMGEDGLISPEDRDAARIEARMRAADLERAEAEVLRLERELADHRVRAPYASVVVARHVDEGTWVGPGAPLMEVSELGAAEVEMRVPEVRLRRLAVGQPATILRGGERIPGVLEAVVPAVDPDSRQGLVRLAPEEEGDLLPGAPVEVEVEAVLAEQALLVSRDAVQDGPRGLFVHVVREGVTAIVPIRVLGQAGELAAVEPSDVAALIPGDRVVTHGAERLRPGQEVRDQAASEGGSDGPGAERPTGG